MKNSRRIFPRSAMVLYVAAAMQDGPHQSNLEGRVQSTISTPAKTRGLAAIENRSITRARQVHSRAATGITARQGAPSPRAAPHPGNGVQDQEGAA